MFWRQNCRLHQAQFYTETVFYTKTMFLLGLCRHAVCGLQDSSKPMVAEHAMPLLPMASNSRGAPENSVPVNPLCVSSLYPYGDVSKAIKTMKLAPVVYIEITKIYGSSSLPILIKHISRTLYIYMGVYSFSMILYGFASHFDPSPLQSHGTAEAMAPGEVFAIVSITICKAGSTWMHGK